MRTISLKLPDDLIAQLQQEAKARHVTRSQLVRERSENSFQNPPSLDRVSCYDLAQDLAGSLKGMPEDLAENPKYMEDFGR